MKIEIPLEGGFNSQYDSEEVGSRFTELVNLVNDKNGKFIKRQALGTEVALTQTHIGSIMHWLAPDGKYYYIVYDTTANSSVGQIKRFSDILDAGSVTIGTFETTPDRIEIDNNGEFVRFTCGHNELPRIYQYIKRSLFWGSDRTYALGGFHFDYAHPRDLVTPNKIDAFVKSIKDTSLPEDENKILLSELFSKGSKTLSIGYFYSYSEHFYYSYSLMYDGVQETLLTETDLNTTHLNFVGGDFKVADGGAIQAEIRFDLGTDLANWNPRITGINIYRGSSSNKEEHKKIITASLKDTVGSISYKKIKDGVTNALYYAEGASFTPNSLVGKDIVIHYSNDEDDTEDFGYKTIIGNTKDCIYVDVNLSNLNDNGSIWGQYLPIVGDIQYDGVDNRSGSSEQLNRWHTTATGDTDLDTTAFGNKWSGYNTYLGQTGNSLGSESFGVLLGETTQTDDFRSYVTSLKIDCDEFPEIDAGASYPQTYKLSIMVGIKLANLNAHTAEADDFFNVGLRTTHEVEPTVSNLSSLDPNDIQQIGGKWLYTEEDFKQVEPQYMQGTFWGSTKKSSALVYPPGDGTLDYLNPAFKICWINITGDFIANAQYQYLYFEVGRRSAITTRAMIFVDNLTIAKTIETHKMYGGDNVIVSPTAELDARNGYKDWAYISNGGAYDGLLNDSYILPDLDPDALIGHIFKNTKRALFLDRYSGVNSYPNDVTESSHFLFPSSNLDNSVFLSTDSSMTHSTASPILVEHWIVGNSVRITGTVYNDKSFTIKQKTATKLIFEETVISETIDNANARLIPGRTVHLSNDYQIRKKENIVSFVFWDRGLSDGEYHSLSTTSSIEVGHKYATNANGRRFVANVSLNPNGDNEIHKDWIIFSELGQPDVLPISNFINIQDLQGGEIHGIETLLGDIVVFVDNGIFRISVPSADPTQWTVSEAIEDIGCSVPDSIITYNGGVFFAGKDNYYYLNPNFELTPVTNSIKNEYQALYKTNMRAIRDFKFDRLILKVDDFNFYHFDLKDFSVNKESWSRHTLDMISEGSSEYLFSNLNYDLFVTRYHSASGSSFVQRLTPPDGTSSIKEVGASLKTGWIPITGSYSRDAMIRRINLRYKSPGEIDVVLYANEDSLNPIWSKKLPTTDEIVSVRVGRRAKNIQLCIRHRRSRYPVEIRRIEIETD